MSAWTPEWLVTIAGTDVTDVSIANLSITSGRTDIYQQPVAGYCSLTLINLTGATVTAEINDAISVQVKDTSGNFVAIYGGTITDIDVRVDTASDTVLTESISIIALGALARLPRLTFTGTVASDFDGDQMYEVLSQYLYGNWNQLDSTVTWDTFDPSQTWDDALNTGLGTIDRPGDYELASHTADSVDVYTLASKIATSGAGYLYEDAQGRINYADSTHRANYIATEGYVDLSAGDAIASDIATTRRAGDVRNSLTVKFGSTGSSEVTESDPDSILTFGELGQVIDTVLLSAIDAEDQAEFYLSLRATPQSFFKQITYQLVSPELSNQDRDDLLAVSMGSALYINNLPTNILGGSFAGFVEGWTFRAGFNTLSLTMNLTPVAFSLPAVRWNGVANDLEWQDLSTIDWLNATQVA
jgi:hypothetical protein